MTEQLCQEVLSLPIFPELIELQQQHVVTILEKILGNVHSHAEAESSVNSIAA